MYLFSYMLRNYESSIHIALLIMNVLIRKMNLKTLINLLFESSLEKCIRSQKDVSSVNVL